VIRHAQLVWGHLSLRVCTTNRLRLLVDHEAHAGAQVLLKATGPLRFMHHTSRGLTVLC
jgi:hypothetical protein